MRVTGTLAWSRFGGALVLVQISGVPADADWAAFVADGQGSPAEAILLIVGDAGLKPSQRADVQRWYESQKVRAVLVTDSLVARGVLKALSWFGVQTPAFASRDLDRALTTAGIPSTQHADARALIARLTEALDAQRKLSPSSQ